jgi:hypothetical protein
VLSIRRELNRADHLNASGDEPLGEEAMASSSTKLKRASYSPAEVELLDEGRMSATKFGGEAAKPALVPH